jgi:hypothetical protein
MAVMAITCSKDGTSLHLEHESYDVDFKVYVGRLICPKCKRTYFDQRKPREARPEQLVLPEWTQPRLPGVER